MKVSQSQTAPEIGIFQVAILLLSMLILTALAADTIWDLPGEIRNVIQMMDTLVCGVLLADFFIRLYRAPSKWAFMKWGWIDLLASIPNLDILRWGRLVRVLRVIRLLRGIRSVHRVITLIFQNKMQGGAVSLSLVAFLLVVFSSISILVCERQEGANIKSAEDAVWWSITTMTTVGYGDKYPVTSEGRIIGAILMFCGVGLFGGITGLMAGMFFGPPPPRVGASEEVLARLGQIESKLDQLLRDRAPAANEGAGGGKLELDQRP